MLESLLQILPVFLIMGFGVVLDILDLLPKRTGSYVGAYVLYAALPMLLLDILSGSSLGDLLHGGFWAGFALSQVLIYILGYTLDYFLARRGHGTAVCFALSCSFSNVAFIGLPVIASLFPGNHVALLAAGITVIVPNLLVIPSQVQLEYLKYANPGAGNAAVEGGQGVANASVAGPAQGAAAQSACLGHLAGLCARTHRAGPVGAAGQGRDHDRQHQPPPACCSRSGWICAPRSAWLWEANGATA